eukprot:CAMPEP_0115852540 /NCGR_PEP_ID=MMETSP0287-20121206/13050_1 /TAXON_ID=412157 /ORGANISM="Chrysochromulina rotalis, Strain UIO044" /LENGTH=56 /DNA_ID=CAMNT_0003306607 /DNA_START=386 /DNA_END=556 /DNA_ORIENTATION=-
MTATAAALIQKLELYQCTVAGMWMCSCASLLVSNSDLASIADGLHQRACAPLHFKG